MHIPKAKSRNVGLIALFAVSSLLLVTASPALAAQAAVGAGVGTGFEYPQWNENTQPDPCYLGLPIEPGTVSGDRFVLHHNGTFAAANTNGVTIALYLGPTDVTIDVGQHVISPEGVGPSCALPIGLVPVQSASVTTPPGAIPPGNVTCTFNGGLLSNYTRRAFEVVAFTLDLNCNIKGNVGLLTAQTSNVRTIMTIEGTMTPCFTPFTGEVENPECTLDPVGPDNADYGSHLITAYDAGGVTP